MIVLFVLIGIICFCLGWVFGQNSLKVNYIKNIHIMAPVLVSMIVESVHRQDQPGLSLPELKAKVAEDVSFIELLLRER